MKKISEVTKLTGVSRRALQEYDKIGLLKPSAKTEAGYWLYDEASVYIISLIQVYTELGYKRKEIKEMLDKQINDPEYDIENEINKTIKMLEEKKKRINGMINLMHYSKFMNRLPESTLKALIKNPIEKYKNLNSKEVFNMTVDELQDYEYKDEFEDDDVRLVSMIKYNLIAIGSMKNKSPKLVLVQKCINDFYRSFIDVINDGDAKVTDEELYSEDGIEALQIIKDTLLSKEDYVEVVMENCGEGAIEFIREAMDFYILLIKNKRLDVLKN